MRVIIQKRRLVNVEDICAVIDDVDSTFVLVDGQMIRVAERYRKHVKDAVFYWKSLFRQSNELLRSEITTAWTSLKEPNVETHKDKIENQNRADNEQSHDEKSDVVHLDVEMKTVQIQTDTAQTNTSMEPVQHSTSIEDDATEDLSDTEHNPTVTERTDKDSSSK